MKSIKLLSFICIVFIPQLMMGQASVVSAPALEAMTSTQNATLMNMTGIMTTIEQIERRGEDLRESVGWLEQLESYQEFIIMVEQIICNSKDLAINMDRAKPFLRSNRSCLTNMRYTLSVNRLRKSVDIINFILVDGFAMESGERLDAMNESMDNYKESNEDLYQLNQELIAVRKKGEREQRYKEDAIKANAF